MDETAATTRTPRRFQRPASHNTPSTQHVTTLTQPQTTSNAAAAAATDQTVPQEKLLTKPPFRFIHDVVSAVSEATGFAAGLYEDRPDLQNGKDIKEKGAKLEYLERIIRCVGLYTGTTTAIKAGKVVAGLEPENTNKWLQNLAAAATSVDAGKSSDCVARAIAGEEPGAGDDPKGEAPAPAAEDKGGRAEGKDADADEPAPAKDDSGKPPASRGGGRQVGCLLPGWVGGSVGSWLGCKAGGYWC